MLKQSLSEFHVFPTPLSEFDFPLIIYSEVLQETNISLLIFNEYRPFFMRQDVFIVQDILFLKENVQSSLTLTFVFPSR